MQALVYHGRKDVRYEKSWEAPRMGPREVRLKVKNAGLCHTDFNEYMHGPLFIAASPHPRTGRSIPLVIGHEFSGQVVEVGSDVHRVRVNDRIAVNAADACGHCDSCRRGLPSLCHSVAFIGFSRDGGFAEYAVAPEECCHLLRPGISYRAGALVEPLSVALHAVKQARLSIGGRAAVIGGGAVGLCVLQALRSTGVREVLVIEKAEAKKRIAQELGASFFVNPDETDPLEAIAERTEGIGADAAFECVGSPAALRTAVEVTRLGGTICVVGIFPGSFEFDFNRLVSHEKTLVTSLGYGDEFPTVIAMLADGRLKAEPLISRTLPLAQALENGLRRYEDFSASNIRTVIEMEA